MKSRLSYLGIVLAGLSCAAVAQTNSPATTSDTAAPPRLTNDPRRPVDQISRDLGIKTEQFVACFRNVSPAEQGIRPSADRVHANKAVLLGCLQKSNSGISNDKLDAVMDRYRPGGREAQMPAS